MVLLVLTLVALMAEHGESCVLPPPWDLSPGRQILHRKSKVCTKQQATLDRDQQITLDYTDLLHKTLFNSVFG